eukprot:EG_transcript_15627
MKTNAETRTTPPSVVLQQSAQGKAQAHWMGLIDMRLRADDPDRSLHIALLDDADAPLSSAVVQLPTAHHVLAAQEVEVAMQTAQNQPMGTLTMMLDLNRPVYVDPSSLTPRGTAGHTGLPGSAAPSTPGMSPFASWKLAATPPAPLPKEALVAMDDFFPTHPKRRPGRPVACRGPRGAADGAEYPGYAAVEATSMRWQSTGDAGGKRGLWIPAPTPFGRLPAELPMDDDVIVVRSRPSVANLTANRH